MKITDITLQKSDGNRANLFIDDHFEFGISLKIIADESLKVGLEITPERLEELRILAGVSGAKKKAFDYLSRRPHSKKELLTKLKKDERFREGAEIAADELEEKGYIDDFSYASMMINHLSKKRWGRKRIVLELRSKGVDAETIESALCEEYDANERENIRDILSRKFSAGMEDRKTRNRAVNFLLRYGYELSDILEELNEDYD